MLPNETVSPESTAQRNELLEKRLLAYAVGACAAGAGLVALPQLAKAEIIFTPAHTTLTSGTLAIDLNHDGIDDIVLTDKSYVITGSWTTQLFNVNPTPGAAVVGQFGNASPLRFGEGIGPLHHFQNGRVLMAGAFRETQISSTFVFGLFANTSHRYLGLKFRFNGQIHYGWAAFSAVAASANPPS